MDKSDYNILDCLTLDPFLRELGYKDFVTSACLALLLLALAQIISYFSYDLSSEGIWNSIKLTLFLLITPCNHIVYKIEHERSNNFMGRCVHDLIFVVMVFTIKKIYSYILSGLFFQSVDDGLSIIFLLISLSVVVMLFEVVVAILKRILRRLRWEIL